MTTMDGLVNKSGAAESKVRRTRFTSNILGPLFVLADYLCLLLAAPIAYFLYDFLVGRTVNMPLHLTALAINAATFTIIRTSKDAYKRGFFNLSDDSDVLIDAFISVFISAAIVWQIGLIDEYSRGISILYMLSFGLLLVLSRPFLEGYVRRLARKGVIAQRVVLYGASRATTQQVRELAEQYLPHVDLVGVADDRPKARAPDGLDLIGGFEELLAMARKQEVDQVMIHMPRLNAKRLKEIVDRLAEVSVDVSVIPDEALEFAPDYRVNLLGPVPVMTLWQRPFRDVAQILKRIEDLLVAVVATVLLSPILLLTALLIKLTSKGPVLFVQPRVGFNNEVIRVFKFRSMYADREDLEGRATTTKDDDRITPVGKVIRRLSIDELPQLLNVLGGSMSIVGPRPHATHMKVGDRYYQDAVAGYAGRHRVKPGMTGLAQVRGLRGEIRTIERAKKRIELDKAYIDNWSVWLDFKIMIQTVRAVLWDSDAY